MEWQSSRSTLYRLESTEGTLIIRSHALGKLCVWSCYVLVEPVFLCIGHASLCEFLWNDGIHAQPCAAVRMAQNNRVSLFCHILQSCGPWQRRQTQSQWDAAEPAAKSCVQHIGLTCAHGCSTQALCHVKSCIYSYRPSPAASWLWKRWPHVLGTRIQNDLCLKA